LSRFRHKSCFNLKYCYIKRVIFVVSLKAAEQMSITSKLFPVPQPLKPQSTVFDLKERLDWGEPALTIIDVRSREAFNANRITGAIAMPADEVVARVEASLERDRDIYVYGDSDEQTAAVAALLRAAGFQRVAELKGGLAAWKAAAGAVEGPAYPVAV
jgi:rhodanese-related sulfurtransferase